MIVVNKTNLDFFMKKNKIVFLITLLITTFIFLSVINADSTNDPKIRVIIAGDSTVHNYGVFSGWGDVLENFFDESKVIVINHAKPGKSSRSFRNEGLWNKLLLDIRKGDWVFIQFGHNDSATIEAKKYAGRGTLPGTGNKTVVTKNTPNNKKEIVHTFGYYMTKCVLEAKKKGANVVIISPVPRNYWTDSTFNRVMNIYSPWCKEVAEKNGAYFIDLEEVLSKKYAELGKDKTDSFFPSDNTHTNKEGALFIAKTLIDAIIDNKIENLISVIKK